MTDITELAQSLKAAADREMICRDGAETSEIWERTVTPENILALVEALEKAQQHITQLESYAEAEATGADKAAEDSVYWMKRCKELESRTVKLPQRYELIGETDGNCSLNDAEMAPDNDGVYLRVRDVREMLTAAGIKVEAE